MNLIRCLRACGTLSAVLLCAVACGTGTARLQLKMPHPGDPEGHSIEGWSQGIDADGGSTPTDRGRAASRFRISPYVQRVSDDAARIVWFSESANAGTVQVGDAVSVAVSSSPRLACELAYHLAELRHPDAARSLPYRHTYQLKNLEPGSTYDVSVEQDGEVATLRVRTPEPTRVQFVVYGDSETEPESSGTHVKWPAIAGSDDERRYPIDQSTGYAANLASIAKRNPDFVAIAGDLVESGGEQRDWDEFWRHNAARASSVPIVPALGNHEYYGGPGDLGGYGGEASRRALAKYASYFDRPPYYTVDHGPIALIVLDTNNGKPERSEMDTNWYLSDMSPEWQTGSAQREWLERELAMAQSEKAYTFVMFHAAPYSSGIHGRPPGVGDGKNFSSGLPMRELTPLFLQYGVDAVFTGHDEMYEHSAVQGKEIMPDGSEAKHTVHFFTVGIGGDGLRGSEPGVSNPYRLFSADRDSPEVYDANGILQDGGKHYGHLLIDVSRADDGSWEAHFEPVYVFPVISNREGVAPVFETRVYDDVLVLTHGRVR